MYHHLLHPHHRLSFPVSCGMDKNICIHQWYQEYITKSVQLPAQPLCCAATAELHITWHGSKGYPGKQCKVTTRELYPKLGCVHPSIYHALECTGSWRDVKFCRRIPHSWSCTLLGYVLLMICLLLESSQMPCAVVLCFLTPNCLTEHGGWAQCGL